MLIECKECHGQVSDSAPTCPHCGIPLNKRRNVMPRSPKRLPNGFGSITRLNRALRKPYLARVTNRKDEHGQPVLKSLGYFKTYNEAYSALLEYNRDPFDLEADMSVKEAYNAYKRDVFDLENHTSSYRRAVERAFEQSEALHSMPIRKVRPKHIKALLAKTDGAHARANLKNFWNRLFDYAVSIAVVEVNYSRNFDLDPVTIKATQEKKRAHLSFSDNEMKVLWSNCQSKVVSAILIQCYTGFRPNELCILRKEFVDLKGNCLIGGSKTEAGMDRVVPIHSAVRPLVECLYENAGEYLLGMDYQQYYYQFKRTIKALGLDTKHRPHDPRKQFVTMAKKAGVDDMAIKKIVGHKTSDVTEAAYTDRDLEWLRSDIEKIDASVYK